MRQLKAFMKAKKRGRCKCLTLNMWRCGEFCGCVNECGEMPEPTPPVPPVPGFTYTLEKTSTRGRKDIYTASKYDNTDTLVKAYSLSVEYNDSDDESIDSFKIGDCTGECVWGDIGAGESLNPFNLAYVDKTEDALSTGTQEAFKEVFEEYDLLYNGDNGKVYYLSNGSYTAEHEGIEAIFEYYIFSKGYWENSQLNCEQSYALGLYYNKSTGDLIFAGMDDSNGSFDFINIQDSSQALALKAEYNSIISNPSQAACKRGFDDAEALWETISPENEIANLEIPDEVLENPTEESLDDLNS